MFPIHSPEVGTLKSRKTDNTQPICVALHLCFIVYWVCNVVKGRLYCNFSKGCGITSVIYSSGEVIFELGAQYTCTL